MNNIKIGIKKKVILVAVSITMILTSNSSVIAKEKKRGFIEEVGAIFVESIVETVADSMINYLNYRYPVNEAFRQELIYKVVQKEVLNYTQNSSL